MQLPRLITPFVGAVAIITGVAAFRTPEVPPSGPTGVASATDAAEVRRIQFHFDSVLSDLSQRDVSALNDVQRAHRGTLLQRLRIYRDRGVFPHNYDFPGQAVPYFVDRRTETLCAVAHLLASSGRRDIVDRVARANNNVWVPELAADTAFTAWLREHGLTVSEAAFIQVPYAQPTSNGEIARNVAFGVAAPLALMGSAITSVVNLRSNSDGHRPWMTSLGAASGLIGIGAGVRLAAFSNGPSPIRTIGAASAAVGAASVALSVRSLYHHRRLVLAEHDAARKATADVSVAPFTTGNRSGAGLALSVQF